MTITIVENDCFVPPDSQCSTRVNHSCVHRRSPTGPLDPLLGQSKIWVYMYCESRVLLDADRQSLRLLV